VPTWPSAPALKLAAEYCPSKVRLKVLPPLSTPGAPALAPQDMPLDDVPNPRLWGPISSPRSSGDLEKGGLGAPGEGRPRRQWLGRSGYRSLPPGQSPPNRSSRLPAPASANRVWSTFQTLAPCPGRTGQSRVWSLLWRRLPTGACCNCCHNPQWRSGASVPAARARRAVPRQRWPRSQPAGSPPQPAGPSGNRPRSGTFNCGPRPATATDRERLRSSWSLPAIGDREIDDRKHQFQARVKKGLTSLSAVSISVAC
jgi:hypothetical protein